MDASSPFGKMHLAVASRDDLTTRDKVVWAILNMHMNGKTGQCNPGYGVLASETRLSISSVSRSIQALEKAGLVTINRRGPKSSFYTMSDPQRVAPVQVFGHKKSCTRASQELHPCKSTIAPVQLLSSSCTLKDNLKDELKSTPKPPSPKAAPGDSGLVLVTDHRSGHERAAMELLQAWNEALPKTVPGADQLLDQNALLTLLTAHGKTVGIIQEYIAFIAGHGKAKFWPRPANLLKHTNQGNGPYVFAAIETEMEAPKNELSTPSSRARDVNQWFGEIAAQFSAP